MRTFKNATEAFEAIYREVSSNGREQAGTVALDNYMLTIENPLDRVITTPERKFNVDYAEAEWLWYLSGDPNIKTLGDFNDGKIPKIWQMIADEDGNVNSNYGYQWNRNNQLERCIELLKMYPDTRGAAISIYDGKEWEKYGLDRCCTYAVQFYIVDAKLNMSVFMRSNDVWFGFGNDQYCFSKLQEMVANRLGIDVGTYTHTAASMHIYENFLGRL